MVDVVDNGAFGPASTTTPRAARTSTVRALARALGATPREVSAGLSAAQVLPAFTGAVLGIPGGIGLYMAVVPDKAPIPPLWWLLAVVAGTVLVVAVLTTIPARLGARRPVAPILQAELA
ncbi:MAG TPA: FtsX-like permease family protein [Jiangellaceae bacterium]|nr:FtsX-like permease family protein [Jiangellaceae bacterium]